MKSILKNYSFALIELILYALAHIYTGFLGDLFYILFCLMMIVIIGIGTNNIYQKEKQFNFKQYQGFYILILICIIYALQGIIRTILK